MQYNQNCLGVNFGRFRTFCLKLFRVHFILPCYANEKRYVNYKKVWNWSLNILTASISIIYLIFIWQLQYPNRTSLLDVQDEKWLLELTHLGCVRFCSEGKICRLQKKENTKNSPKGRQRLRLFGIIIPCKLGLYLLTGKLCCSTESWFREKQRVRGTGKIMEFLSRSDL